MRRARSTAFLVLIWLALGSAAHSPLRAAEGLVLGQLFESPAVAGSIWCIEEFDGELVIGGQFDRVGSEAISTIAAWNGSSWRSLGLDAAGLQRVYCMTVFDGDLVVGVAKNETAEQYRVLRRFGSVWLQIGGELSSAPRALAVHEGSLYVGLEYSIISRGERPLYRLIADSWLAAGFPVGEIFTSVHSLLSDGETLYVGGSFDGFSNPVRTPRGVYAYASSSSLWSLVGNGLESDAPPLSDLIPMGHQGVHDLAMYDGDLYATGSFVNEADGLAGMARWTGAAWEALPTIGVGRHLTISSQGLVATGLLAHDTGGGNYEYFLGAWDGVAWNSLDPATNASPLTISASSYGGQLVLARDGVVDANWRWGGYTPHGPSLTMWDGVAWTSPIAGSSPGGEVQSIIEFDGSLVVGGLFEFAGAIGSPGVASFDGSNWHPLGKGLLPDVGDYYAGAGVQDFAEYAGSLVAAGRFYAPGENHVSAVAFWNGSEWGSLGPGLAGGSTDGAVFDLAVYDGELYAFGKFSEFNGLAANGIARYDGANWEALAVNDATRRIHAAELFQGELVIGGGFQRVDGVLAQGLARFDGVSWGPVAPAEISSVADLEAFQGLLYIARSPDIFQPLGESTLLAWDGLVAPTPVVDPASPDYFLGHAVTDLLDDSSELHLITYSPPTFSREIISWDGASLQTLEIAGAELQGLYSGFPSALGMASGRIYLGGRWSMEGASAPQHLARLIRATDVAVSRISLEARREPRGVVLNWQLEKSPRIFAMTLEHAGPARGWAELWSKPGGSEFAGEWIHGEALGAGEHRYRLSVDTPDGRMLSPVASVDWKASLAGRSEITRVSPNPFNPATIVEFRVAESGTVRLRVFDISGRLVRTLVDRQMLAGIHSRVWNGTDLRDHRVGSGVYLMMLEANGKRHVRRVALLQ